MKARGTSALAVKCTGAPPATPRYRRPDRAEDNEEPESRPPLTGPAGAGVRGARETWGRRGECQSEGHPGRGRPRRFYFHHLLGLRKPTRRSARPPSSPPAGPGQGATGTAKGIPLVGQERSPVSGGPVLPRKWAQTTHSSRQPAAPPPAPLVVVTSYLLTGTLNAGPQIS